MRHFSASVRKKLNPVDLILQDITNSVQEFDYVFCNKTLSEIADLILYHAAKPPEM